MLIGGDPALDFCNTVSWRASPEPIDHLAGYRAWLEWCGWVDGASDASSPALVTRAEAEASAAESAWERAADARDTIGAVFDRLARGEAVPPAELEALRLLHLEGLGRGRLVESAGGVRLTWEDERALDAPLWPLVDSAWSLLIDPDRPRIGMCDGAGCGWLFVDRSRNGSRRWCSDRDCGRRERVRRHRSSRG